MKKHKSRKIFIIIPVVLLCMILLVGFYFLFAPKSYRFFSSGTGNKEVTYLEVWLQGGDEEMIYHSVYKIDDKDNINKILESLNSLSLKPYFSLFDSSDEKDEKWNIHVYGETEKYFSIMLLGHTDDNTGVVSTGMFSNGIGTGGFRDLIDVNTVSSEDDRSVRNAVLEAIEDEIAEMTREDIARLSEEDNHNWLDFEKYYYENNEQLKKELIASGSEHASEAATFYIKDTDCYMYVWYSDAIIVTGDEAERNRDVWKAEIYNSEGGSIDLYDPEAAEFLKESVNEDI